jgi:PAS domain S-box-containing protein
MFRLMVESSSDIVTIVDSEGYLRFASPSVERILGYEPKEMIGRRFEEFIHIEDLADLRVLLSGEWSRRPQGNQVELRCRHANGTWRVLEAISRVFRDTDGCERFVIDSRDVSERRRMEEELRRSEGRYRSLFERNMAGVVRTLCDGTILECNEAFARQLGYQRSELEGSNIEKVYLDIDDRNQFLALLREQGAVSNYEFCYRHRNGSKVWLLGNSTMIGDPATGPMVGTVVDITSRKHLEEQLRQSQKMEAIGRLAGGVAHDFNNLLTVIAGHCEIAYESLAADDTLRWSMAEIKRATERASALTTQLLTFSRRQVVQPKILNINEVLLDMHSMLRRMIGEDVELVIRQDPELGRIRADQTQVEQVILNLAVNARDAMPHGGKLIVETENAVHADAPMVLLSVTDTGCGMDAQTKSHIFEPFFTTKAMGKGTGLGLSTVYGTVAHNGGHIDVISEIGRGTTFHVYFPRTHSEERPQTEASGPFNISGSETILVVEDEAMVRQMVCEVLCRLGYRIITAEDGLQALALARQSQPADLVLTDVVMPRLGGRQMVDQLSSIWPGARVLYMSGYTDDAVVHHGVNEHNVAFLQKPFTPDALARKVRAVLDH